MSGNITITDIDGTILNETNFILVEEQVASEELFTHLVPISGEIYYISSYLKWSTIGAGTASAIFNRIPNLISVSDSDGNIFYANGALTSTLNALTDEKVYKIIRSRGASDTLVRLHNGKKITHTLPDGSIELGFDYQFSLSGDNWFPWCIERARPIETVFGDDLVKINKIADSFGNVFQPFQNNTNSLFELQPGQGYIVDAKQNFTLTFLERTDMAGVGDSQVPLHVPPPRIAPSVPVSNKVLLSITPDNLNTAILQIPKNSLISALEVSTVNAIIDDDSTFPEAGTIKTFHAARGQQITFDTLMAISDDYAGTIHVYNRYDFQAIFNAQLLELQTRKITHVIQAQNASGELISNKITLTAYDLLRIDSSIFLNVGSPITQTTNSKTINIVIKSDTVDRKYTFINVNESYNGNVQSSLSSANASNPVFPKATVVDDPKWKAGEVLRFENLYCTNPT